ncbi:transcription factor tfb2 subfamily protein [Acanthamoeba castellanii str. Neff]|uniref:General transcription factor IIH subunit 4 n=1 Tax=Acanthamoeba castellanii (strain ATCC 30010 / Neff) TaxID=1257118 RepID=L8H8M7_ACACF|nr:transcription factor tfb2 subfamily protein [Acanthamoeba castellanii str. Neff]ELR21525.1 transcription factor tfb2 subfamily protein [Acanthamoeba castellanii str. Neff]
MGEVEAYLTALPQAALDNLYADPWTCQAVFRSLPALAKQWVLRLAFASPSITRSRLLQHWTSPRFQSQGEAALRRLLALRILRERLPADRRDHGGGDEADVMEVMEPLGGGVAYEFNKHFGSNFQKMDGEGEEEEEAMPTREELAAFTTSCWDTIFLFIMGSTVIQPPSDRVVSLLTRGEFMVVHEEDQSIRIADKGFPFLLKDLRTQVWTLLLLYLRSLQEEKANVHDVLSFLFRLSFLTVGEGYQMDDLAFSESGLLQDLQDLGIIYRKHKDSKWLYPTQLAIGLSSTEAAKRDQEGWIIVGTDYRIYAYTSSPVKLLLLSLFTQIEYQLPNMVMGILLRENIRQAVQVGISANQILQFLETNAHPQMKQNTPIIPESIADQLRLWEAEDRRLSLSSGYFYDDFASLAAFKKAEKYARDVGALIYSDATKRFLFVSEPGHQLLRRYVKQHLSSSSSSSTLTSK